MRFGGIQRCSTIDFPGNLCCVLFVCGCDMNCFYCHNRALLTAAGPVADDEITHESVLDFLKSRVSLLDGVVISGGEPTLHDDLPALLREIRALGFRCKLDTNGRHPEAVEALLKERLLDYAAVDLKALPEDYAWVCGAEDGFSKAMETINLLSAHALPFEARTTLYPGLTMDALFALIGHLPPLPRYRLNVFHMPETARKEDALLLRRDALKETDILEHLAALRALQPNILL